MADVEFTKVRGKDRKPNLEVNLEEFISVKGINALGNQLTRDKINQINLLDPLPFDPSPVKLKMLCPIAVLPERVTLHLCKVYGICLRYLTIPRLCQER